MRTPADPGVDAPTPAGARPGAPASERWQPPLLWRAAMQTARAVIAPFCRLRISGEVPAELRGGPLILAANHIGSFDPFVLTAACGKARLAPRIMATGDLFRAPIVGPLMRWAGHIRVDRRRANVTDALEVGSSALAAGSVLLGYPEGRITLDPAMRPERGKTGLARLALATGVPVVPVSQWGAHLVLPWGAPRGSTGRLLWALLHRPIVRVHFGPPLRLGDSRATPAGTGGAASGTGGAASGPAGAGPAPKAVQAATVAIMDAIVDGLAPLRPAEPGLPAWIDPARPLSAGRTHERRGGSGSPNSAPAA